MTRRTATTRSMSWLVCAPSIAISYRTPTRPLGISASEKGFQGHSSLKDCMPVPSLVTSCIDCHVSVAAMMPWVMTELRSPASFHDRAVPLPCALCRHRWR
jgi:hypothetical protein